MNSSGLGDAKLEIILCKRVSGVLPDNMTSKAKYSNINHVVFV